ncbi:MAG: hypothetical protein ACYC0V_12050 [Armatimonadota bacterium]
MNIMQALSENDLNVILTCMRIISEGDELEGEYQTRLGVDEKTLCSVITAFPHLVNADLDDANLQIMYGVSQLDIDLAIHGCLNEVCYGIQINDIALKASYGFSREDARIVFEEYICRKHQTNT